MTRFREYNDGAVSGTVTRTDPWGGFNQVAASGHKSNHYVEDVPGPGDGLHFYVDHYIHDDGFVATGMIPFSFGVKRTWAGFPLQAFRNPKFRAQHISISTPPTGAMAAELLARTSPNAPGIDLPVFIKELPEISEIFRFFASLSRRMRGGAVNEALSKLASANLTWEFGLKPLLSDVRSLLSFHDMFEKKLQELSSLQSSGLRRKRTLFQASAAGSEPKFAASSETSFVIDYYGIGRTELECWGFVKWFPTGNFRSFSNEQLRRKAMEISLGLNVDVATLWQAMPWTWLADWCSSAGDLLEAYRHGVPCTHSIPQIMIKRETTWEYKNDNAYPQILPEKHVRKRITKQRIPASASLTAYMPFLSGRQVAILGSLAVLKSGNKPQFRSLAGNG